jgi:hypothetical protein
VTHLSGISDFPVVDPGFMVEKGYYHPIDQGNLDAVIRQGYPDDMVNSSGQASAATGTGTGTVYCSFCIKDKGAVAKLIAGPGVYICNECVGLCDLLLANNPDKADNADQPAPDFGSWDERPDEELLASLARMQAVTSQVNTAVHDQVGIMRARGISWTRIGEALGVSKQSAWERFSGED